jgi:hypothetical protein
MLEKLELGDHSILLHQSSLAKTRLTLHQRRKSSPATGTGRSSEKSTNALGSDEWCSFIYLKMFVALIKESVPNFLLSIPGEALITDRSFDELSENGNLL